MNSLTKQRYISTSIWSDVWFDSLSGTEKLIYFYLLTNVHTNPAGVYPFALKYIGADTGFSRDEINKAMKKFEDDGKAFYYREYIIIPKWLKHQKIKERSGLWMGTIKVLKNLPDEIKAFISDRTHYDYDISEYLGNFQTPSQDPVETLPHESIDPPIKNETPSQDNPQNLAHDLNLDLDLEFDLDKNIHRQETPETLSKHFIHRWQHAADVFNCLARLKCPKDWQVFWEQNTFTLEQIDIALDNFIAGVKSGAIERRYIPSSPDGFVINGWLSRCQNTYKQQGQRISNDNVSEEDISKYFTEVQ